MEMLAAVLVASLLGSVHCAAMCGAFVCFYAGSPAGRATPRDWRPHTAYNAGRLVSYVALGAIFGTLGGAFDRAGTLVGIARAAAIVSGTAMVLWGVATLLALRGVRIPSVGFEALRPALGSVLLRVGDWSPTGRAVTTGLVTTLLPCGWLYAFAAVAAGTGSATRGVVTMIAFWVGTLPMMIAVGVGAQRVFGRFRRGLPAMSAAAVVVIGLLAIFGRMQPPDDAPTHRHSDVSAADVAR
jgi:uncharacterized protein